jgi:hypothetical protein
MEKWKELIENEDKRLVEEKRKAKFKERRLLLEEIHMRQVFVC